MILSEFEFRIIGFSFKEGHIEAEPWQLVVALIAIVFLIALPLIVYNAVIQKRNGEKFVFTTRDVAYAAVCIAMSYALSFIGYRLPQGGTITFASILPIATYIYFFGFRKGAIAATVYMLLQLLQNPNIISPWSMLLDYVLPYLSLTFIGLFFYNANRDAHVRDGGNGTKRFALLAHWKFFVGLAVYTVIRYASHVLSGVLFYGIYAEGKNVLLYSLGYNSFALIDTAIAAVAGGFLLSSRAFTRTLTDAAIKSKPRKVIKGEWTKIQ